MIGHIYVWRALPGDGAFAWFQKFLTGVAYRHTSGGVGNLFGTGEWQFEMILCGATTPLDSSNPKVCREFKINAPDNVVKSCVINCMVQNAGKTYGFLSLLNYVPRRLVELVGFNGRKVAPIHIGNVCSSSWLEDCLVPLAHLMGWNDLTAKIGEWNRNVFQSGDMVNLLLSFPQYFTEIG